MAKPKVRVAYLPKVKSNFKEKFQNNLQNIKIFKLAGLNSIIGTSPHRTVQFVTEFKYSVTKWIKVNA